MVAKSGNQAKIQVLGNLEIRNSVIFWEQLTNDSIHLTGKFIIDKFNSNKESIGFKCAFNNARFMKLTNYIRAKELLPLVSCSTGYYITNDADKLEECAQSLEDRTESILAAAAGSRRMVASMRLEKSLKETCPLGFTWD